MRSMDLEFTGNREGGSGQLSRTTSRSSTEWEAICILATQLDVPLCKYLRRADKTLKLNKLKPGVEPHWVKGARRGRKYRQRAGGRRTRAPEKEGYVCGPDTVWQKEFEEMFLYEETEDQLNAIEDTKRDMESTKIMDRLVCGDVGYGKTEVALRTSLFLRKCRRETGCVSCAYHHFTQQVSLTPFVQRMKEFPVRVDLLCRFRTPAQQKKTLQDLKKGQVDVVIGTHRVLSKDVEYQNLGLLIVDEEQRFGVTHRRKSSS